MSTDYWKIQGEKHHIDKKNIELECFRLISIFEADRAYRKNLIEEAIEAKEIEPNNIFNLDSSNFMYMSRRHLSAEVSRIILNLALYVRLLDDLEGLSYKNSSSIGAFGEEKATLREACNKIIHATNIRICKGRTEEEFEGEPLLFLTGEVELNGKKGNDDWFVTLYVDGFVSHVIDALKEERD